MELSSRSDDFREGLKAFREKRTRTSAGCDALTCNRSRAGFVSEARPGLLATRPSSSSGTAPSAG